MKNKNYISTGVASFGAKQIEKLQLDSSQQASLIKRALIVFEGTHMGMFGPVTLTKEFLQIMVERFNREYANPKNENDYPPVLKEHERNTDDLFGRVIPDLVLVEDWVNPRTGEKAAAIFGDLRIDDPDAQLKIAQGKYSNISISFDDDMDNLGEIFEVSFVAVEAARGAQVLQKNNKENSMNLEELQARLGKSQKALATLKGKRSDRSLALKASVKSLSASIESAKDESKKIGEQIVETATALRKGIVKGQFKEFVREGRLSKAEFEKIDIASISLMSADAQKVVLSSYKGRPVSADLIQHGTQDAQPLEKKDVKKLSTQDTRELIKAQREGRKANLSQSLAEGDPAPKDDDKPADLGNPEEDIVDLTGLTMEDIDDALGKLSGLAEMQSKLEGAVDKMKETLAGLQGDNEKDEEE